MTQRKTNRSKALAFLEVAKFGLQEIMRAIGVMALFLVDNGLSGTVLALVLLSRHPLGSSISNLKNDIATLILYVVALSISIALSVVVVRVSQTLWRIVTGKQSSIRSHKAEFVILLVLGLAAYIGDIYLDGMITPFFLYQADPNQHFVLAENPTAEYSFWLLLFRGFSAFGEFFSFILLRDSFAENSPLPALEKLMVTNNSNSQPSQKKKNQRRYRKPKQQTATRRNNYQRQTRQKTEQPSYYNEDEFSGGF